MVEGAILNDARFMRRSASCCRSHGECCMRSTPEIRIPTPSSPCRISCYEDVCAYRIDGLEFHLALIQQMSGSPVNRPARFDMLTPRVQIYGDTGIVTYTRLMTYDEAGRPRWTTFNETRVFVRQDGAWRMAHFHRSPS